VPGPKPKLFIMASIHAREYAPAELATRFAETLLEGYGSDPDITWLLDYREIHLLLQANPDGRKQAEKGWIGDYMWRKNTDANYCTVDPMRRGADLNRNFPFHWGGGGSSGDECDETYRGAASASEPETQAVINYLKSQFPDRRADDLTSPAPDNTSGLLIDLHSYGNQVLWPWGWTESPAPNQTGLETLGRKLAFINHYKPEQSVFLYATDGSTNDFAYGELGLAAYTFEVGTDFFQDCATFENTILPDNLPALLAAAKAAGKPYLEPSGPETLSVSITPTLSTTNNTAQISAFVDNTRSSTQNFHNIAAAEYTIDTPFWITTTTPITHSLAAMDGSFDQTTEYVSATIDTSGLSDGRHLVFVRGKNSAGYWGATSSAFLNIFQGCTCTPINNIDLNKQDSKLITVDEPVTLTATIQPNWATTPITYTIDFGDDTPSNPITSTQTTQIFTHTYASAGYFQIQVRAWNCGVPPQQAMPSSLDIEVVQNKYLFLPIIQ
jgi:carboxypeptidase T